MCGSVCVCVCVCVCVRELFTHTLIGLVSVWMTKRLKKRTPPHTHTHIAGLRTERLQGNSVEQPF